MTYSINNKIPEKTPIQCADFANVTEADVTDIRKLSFADLHALYEFEYEKFIMDISVEIEQCTQKLLELESIASRKLFSDRKDK